MTEVLAYQIEGVESESIEVALKDLKDCQTKEKVPNCIMCRNVTNCAKKEAFALQTLSNLSAKESALKQCQNTKGLESCLQCAEVLECVTRSAYVHAVYLSMNKGNGGNFEF